MQLITTYFLTNCKDEMNRHLEQGNLRRLEVALSRIQKDKVYVTHKYVMYSYKNVVM